MIEKASPQLLCVMGDEVVSLDQTTNSNRINNEKAIKQEKVIRTRQSPFNGTTTNESDYY